LEDFWVLKLVNQSSNILQARMEDSFNQLKLAKIKAEKVRGEKINNLNINASSILVFNNESGAVFDKNADQLRPIASLTKLITALVAKDIYDNSQIIEIDKKTVDQEGLSDFKIGDKVSVKNLISQMLIESSNDAAYALTLPITEKAFVDLMNLKAKEIGLRNTRFFNVTGLDPDNPRGFYNISTANDLATLANYILKNQPEIFQITANRDFAEQSTNELLIDYPEIVGGKTGTTPAAGECFLVVMQKPNKQDYYVNVLLNSKDRFSDMRKIIEILR